MAAEPPARRCWRSRRSCCTRSRRWAAVMATGSTREPVGDDAVLAERCLLRRVMISPRRSSVSRPTRAAAPVSLLGPLPSLKLSMARSSSQSLMSASICVASGEGGDGRQDGPTIRGVRTRRLIEVELRSAGRGCAGFGGRTCSRLRSLEDEDAISLVRERARESAGGDTLNATPSSLGLAKALLASRVEENQTESVRAAAAEARVVRRLVPLDESRDRVRPPCVEEVLRRVGTRAPSDEVRARRRPRQKFNPQRLRRQTGGMPAGSGQ